MMHDVLLENLGYCSLSAKRGCSKLYRTSWSPGNSQQLLLLHYRRKGLSSIEIARGEVRSNERGLGASCHCRLLRSLVLDTNQHRMEMIMERPTTSESKNASALSAACCSETMSMSLQQQPRRQWPFGHFALKWRPSSKFLHTSVGTSGPQVGQQLPISFTIPKPIRWGR